ncbi:MAG: imidazole glycerol phosphate synthase, glutamine amidotransferase subunit [Candidatus Solincola sediminis]|uniref:Imidazole glycerol phosphate synthase subunit HisH n=1 Tax=Candidatus Solincola sediminis TaxID=1797199 RepID=A0A1F2WGL0_9ACTN|nr:MAG: imidazole glycerol phosphate synthase, glutamine amidotransferase subunit [Candidatus Solincola sediminis]OFW58248.1 MAG: imidazole glycerol phosphate synthase, glutamine amidotransferase subunit [Candidatus Solincola sediminis]
MIGIIDYGMGNLRSVEKAFAFLGHEVFVTSDVARLLSARAMVLPGVGAFGDAMRELQERNLVEPILQWVRDGRPFLGICLGCQLLFDASEESPGIGGLGIIPGEVVRFPNGVKVPHMGWNDLGFGKSHPILDGVKEGSFFYFVHSYYVRPKADEHILTVTDYGSRFASGVSSGKLVAFQFHPEKSSDTGLRLLDNFAGL